MSKIRQLVLLAILLNVPAVAQSLSGINGDCMIGGEQALTSGLPSTATQQIGTTNVNAGAGVQASFPLCLVTVYATGTTNKANIFSDNLPVPTAISNPLTANVDGSFTFFVASGCYDVVMSTGTGPALPYSRSLTDVCVGTGGGGGSTDIGTPNQVVKVITPTSFGDSSGFDDGTNPTQWPNGVSLMQRAGFSQYVNDTSTGTVLNHLVMLNGANQVVQNTSTTSILGIADVGSGNVGTVQVARVAKEPCVFDNQTVANDWVTAGTPADQCHDSGATKPTGIMIIGRVITVNSGAGTLATVDLFTGDTNPAGVNSGAVNLCSTPGAVAFYALAGITVSCDPSLLSDGAGNGTGQSWTLLGPGAGFFGLGQGTAPSLAQTNSIYFAAPASVTTSYVNIFPAAGPTTTGCLQGSTSGTTTTLSWTGSGCGSGSGTVTNVAESFTGGLISVSGSPITTSGTLALTVAGTSGGIPYFSGASTWASSGALTANLPVIGGGAGLAPSVGTRSGNTTTFVTTIGSLTNTHCVQIDANGNFVDSGTTCAAGGTRTKTIAHRFDWCVPGQTANGGNSGASTNPYTNADLGVWEFTKNTAADVWCYIRIPSNVDASPAASVILDFGANDNISGHTDVFNIADVITSSLNLNVGALTNSSTCTFTTTTTTYANTECTFTPAATIAADQILVVKIHQAASNSVTADVLMPSPTIKFLEDF